MIQELRERAFNDLVNIYWDSERKHFKYSQSENISSPAINSVCLLAINSMENRGKEWIYKHRSELISTFLKDNSWTDAGGHYNNTMATAFGIIALSLLDPKNKRLSKEYKFLIESQLENGSWSFLGYKAGDYEEHPYFTYWTLRALLEREEALELWPNTIRPAFYYLCEAAKEFSTKPTSYCMIRHGLSLIENNFGLLFDEDDNRALASIYQYKIERHQRKDGTWKQEPEVVSRANFRKSLFTIKNLYFLTGINYKTISDIHSNMITWIDDNYHDPGWSSDTEASHKGVSWATAYVLMGLSSFDSALKDYLGA